MTLYYSLVFVILVIEMAIVIALSLPLPGSVRKTVIKTLNIPFRSAEIQIGLKFVLAFILLLFIDSVNRVYKASPLDIQGQDGNRGSTMFVGSDRSEMQARKFYAQRNMYLCGFTLFLSLVLNRLHSVVNQVLELKDELQKVITSSSKAEGAAESAIVKELKAELEKKDRDIQALKKQAEGLSKEYEKVSDELNSKSAVVSDKKSD